MFQGDVIFVYKNTHIGFLILSRTVTVCSSYPAFMFYVLECDFRVKAQSHRISNPLQGCNSMLDTYCVYVSSVCDLCVYVYLHWVSYPLQDCNSMLETSRVCFKGMRSLRISTLELGF